MGDYCPFENWKIEKLIGEGDFGEVYQLTKGEEKSVFKKIVLRKEGNLFDNTNVEQKNNLLTKKFVDEINLLQKTKGNNHIVNYMNYYLDSDGDDDTIYIQMEYLYGLANHFKDKELDTKTILEMLYQILDGLIVLEENNVIHGNIKPQNIMVDKDGNYKLTDIGISRIISEGKEAKLSYISPYAAPEVIYNHSYSLQSDLYSLGLLIYQFFNDGLLPFMKDENDVQGAINQRLDNPLVPPKYSNDTFYNFLNKALSVGKKDRFKSAQEMKLMLKKMEENSQIPQVTIVYPLILSTAHAVSNPQAQVDPSKLETTRATGVHTGIGLAAKVAAFSTKTKIIGVVAALLLVCGGTYAVNKMTNNTVDIKKLTVDLDNEKTNMISQEYPIRVTTEPKTSKSDIDYLFSNKNITYNKNGIINKLQKNTNIENLDEIINITVKNKMVYVYGNTSSTGFINTYDYYLKEKTTTELPEKIYGIRFEQGNLIVVGQKAATYTLDKSMNISKTTKYTVIDENTASTSDMRTAQTQYSTIKYGQDEAVTDNYGGKLTEDGVSGASYRMEATGIFGKDWTLNAGKSNTTENSAVLLKGVAKTEKYTYVAIEKDYGELEFNDVKADIPYESGNYILVIDEHSNKLVDYMSTSRECTNLSYCNGYLIASSHDIPDYGEESTEVDTVTVYDIKGEKFTNHQINEEFTITNANAKQFSDFVYDNGNYIGYAITSTGVEMIIISKTDCEISVGNKKKKFKMIVYSSGCEADSSSFNVISKKKDSYDKKETTQKKAANNFENDKCSFMYPKEWIGKVEIEDEGDYIVFNYKESPNRKNDGQLYFLSFTKEKANFWDYEAGDYYPGVDTQIKKSSTGVYVYGSKPTDLTHTGDNVKEFMELTEVDHSIIKQTFRFKE